MKKWWRDAAAISIIVLLIAPFFIRLFYPVPQIIVTPDYGLSDAWNSGFAIRFALGEALHKGTIPLWSQTIGDGFPIYSIGEPGTFFLPNLIFFSLFDAVTAYNLALVVSVITAAVGLYLWLRVLNLPRMIGIAATTTLGLSGIVIAQLTHLTLLQSFGMMPFVMAATHVLADRPGYRRAALLAVLYGQQILSGFPQGVFITLCFSAPYFFWLTWKKHETRGLFWYGGSVAMGVLLGAVQLLPSQEFLKEIMDSSGDVFFFASQFAYPFRHLLTFLSPFILGNPKFGTYQYENPAAGSIFWENTGYIGLLPLVFIPFVFRKRRLREGVTLFTVFAAAGAFLLMLGKQSPLYLLYSFWPFTLFRVPSRFIWIFVLSLLVLSAYGLTSITQSIKSRLIRYVFMLLVIAMQTYMLAGVWWNYHAIEPAAQLLHASTLGTGATRTFDLNLADAYYNRFIKEGWKTMAPYDELGTILPNANLITHIPSHGAYAGRTLRRGALLDSLLNEETYKDTYIATISAEGHSLLDIMGITTIYSVTPIDDPSLTLNRTIEEAPVPLFLYDNATAVPRAYMTSSLVVATTREEAKQQISDESFIPGKSVLLEEPLDIAKTDTDGTARILTATDESVAVLVTDHPQKNVLVLGDTYYPGWKARIDGKETRMYPANVKYRAVVVPAGDHIVTFSYEPASFRIGVWLSSITWTLVICLAGFRMLFAKARTDQEVSLPDRRRRNNRGTSHPHKM